jgi:hypothetical protein
LKLLEGNVGKTLQDKGIGNDFLNSEKDYSSSGNNTIDFEETAYRRGENLCHLFIGQGLLFRIHKELKK